MPLDETRQTATSYALAWATCADKAATDYRYANRPHDPDSPLARQLDRLANLGHEARETALMWASIARLLPAVLNDQRIQQQNAPDQCCQRCPCTGAMDQAACNPCCACGKGRLQEPGAPERCPSRHAFDDYTEHCERQAGHHGIHTARGLQWGPNDPATTGTNETPTTSPERHPDCFIEPCRNPHCGDNCAWRRRPDSPIVVGAKLPGPRPAGDDLAPRCQSRRDGEQCERADGHSGIHQGATCGWRNSSSATEPVTPTVPEAARCCQLAVAHVAEQLERHARTAPGLTELERRCLEDAGDFVRAHMPAAAMPEAWCAAKTPHGPHTCLWGGGPFRCPGYPGGQL